MRKRIKLNGALGNKVQKKLAKTNQTLSTYIGGLIEADAIKKTQTIKKPNESGEGKS